MEKIAKAARHEKTVARGKERTGGKANKIGADARYGFEGGALMLEDELEVSALRDYQKRQAGLQETIELPTKGLDTLNQQRRSVAQCIPSAELPKKERFAQLNSLSERTGIEEDSLVVRRKARRTLHFLPYITPHPQRCGSSCEKHHCNFTPTVRPKTRRLGER